MNKSIYFLAEVERTKCHIVSSTFQFVEHIAFYRTIDVEKSILEFFVAPDVVDVFLDVMQALKKINVVYSYEEKQNRLID